MYWINIRHEPHCHRRIDVAQIIWRFLGSRAETISMRDWSRSSPSRSGPQPLSVSVHTSLLESLPSRPSLVHTVSIFGHTLTKMALESWGGCACDTCLVTRALVTPGCQKKHSRGTLSRTVSSFRSIPGKIELNTSVPLFPLTFADAYHIALCLQYYSVTGV